MENILRFLNANLGLLTFLTAISAYYIYWKQKRDDRRDAARIILQEIRRAEEIIKDYTQFKIFVFTKKIIAVNSWSKNIHHFVGTLDTDELDRVSNLYSTGEYLDAVIGEISNYKLQSGFGEYHNQVQQLVNPEKAASEMKPIPSEKEPSEEIERPLQLKNVVVQIKAPWEDMLIDITTKYEFIYNSPIAEKLKKIAKVTKI
jgi:hypothetical protein